MSGRIVAPRAEMEQRLSHSPVALTGDERNRSREDGLLTYDDESGSRRRTIWSRRLQGRRWWNWFVLLAALALVHDFALAGLSTPAHGESPAGEVDGTGGDSDHNDHGHDEGHGGGHADPVAPVLAAIVIILLLAKMGGDVFERLKMPAVLGELVVGVLLGNVAFLTGWDGLDFLKPPPDDYVGSAYSTGAILKILAGIGVVLLLFEVGLESSVRQMLSVGTSSLVVAILGVVVPIALGYSMGKLLIADAGWEVPAFLGATLCATSVGITARVLKDLGRSQDRESRIILGAAVIDDVLGLVVLAVVSGVIVASQTASEAGNGLVWDIVTIVLYAFGFILGALLLGALRFQRAVFYFASFLRGHGLMVATALVVCFGFAWLANQVQLAPIVGAFAAGLILEGAHYRELGARENHDLEEALAPLSALLVPIFFVQMGIQVNLASFTNPSVWGLAAAITIAAVIGKQVCSLGVLEKGLNRVAVGLGMIPRGEVGLIFANEGRKLKIGNEPVINDEIYSAVIVMVMLTTMITPPLLKWSMAKDGDEEGSTGDADNGEEAYAAHPEPAETHHDG